VYRDRIGTAGRSHHCPHPYRQLSACTFSACCIAHVPSPYLEETNKERKEPPLRSFYNFSTRTTQPHPPTTANTHHHHHPPLALQQILRAGFPQTNGAGTVLGFFLLRCLDRAINCPFLSFTCTTNSNITTAGPRFTCRSLLQSLFQRFGRLPFSAP
jgi:hypothetical protein